MFEPGCGAGVGTRLSGFSAEKGRKTASRVAWRCDAGTNQTSLYDGVTAVDCSALPPARPAWLDSPVTAVEERAPSFVRPDGREKVTGTGRYTADLTLTGQLHAAFRYVDHPHARITRVDTAKARALTGVIAVVTHEDVPGEAPHRATACS